jgi:hypothetical protein
MPDPLEAIPGATEGTSARRAELGRQAARLRRDGDQRERSWTVYSLSADG